MQIPNLETVFEWEQIFCTAHAQKCEIFKKVEFLHDHEEVDIDNGTVIFRDWSLLEKLTIYSIWPILKLSIFKHQLIWPKLLYLGNRGDLRDGVGDIFACKVMQIPNLETVFESEQIWNFLYHATP